MADNVGYKKIKKINKNQVENAELNIGALGGPFTFRQDPCRPYSGITSLPPPLIAPVECSQPIEIAPQTSIE